MTAFVAAVALVFYPATLILAALDHGWFGPFNLPAAYALVTLAPKGYLALFFGLLIAGGTLNISLLVLDHVLAANVAVGAIFTVVQLLGGVVMARMLGLFLRHHEEELGLVA